MGNLGLVVPVIDAAFYVGAAVKPFDRNESEPVRALPGVELDFSRFAGEAPSLALVLGNPFLLAASLGVGRVAPRTTFYPCWLSGQSPNAVFAPRRSGKLFSVRPI